MWMEGWGIEISETILITETGCETLAGCPRDICVKA
jgi:Xaa-Pro dipeptidase